MANLRQFRGAIYPVSSRLMEIDGRRCYASLGELPDAPDCVVLAIPSDAIETVLVECADAGARSAVVFASGYAELGHENGVAAQTILSRIAAERNLRIAGPNTTGIANLVSGAHCGFAEFPHRYVEAARSIAIVAQSGAMSLAFSQAAERGVSISHVMTCGNSCDVDVADYVNALAGDQAVNAIALTFEGLADPAKLEAAALHAARSGKPIVCLKIGKSAAGTAAACWHTGSNAGFADDWDFLLESSGIVSVSDPAALLETTVFLAKTRKLRARSLEPSIAILSSSGGMGILAADRAERAGVSTPQPGDDISRRLAAVIPSFGSPRNPCDVTAQATSNPQSVVDCADILLGDNTYDALVIPWGKAWRSSAFEGLAECAKRHGKPVIFVWMSQWLDGPGARELEEMDELCLFRSLDNCMSAVKAWASRND